MKPVPRQGQQRFSFGILEGYPLTKNTPAKNTPAQLADLHSDTWQAPAQCRLRVAWIHIVFVRLLQRHLNDEHFSHDSISTKLTADDHFGRLLWKIFELASSKVAVIIRLLPCADLRCYRALT